MNFIAHRGFWNDQYGKNSEGAFIHALQLGYGIETDVRDLNGDLVISHDPPLQGNKKLMSFDQFLSLYSKYRKKQTLALNIKSDGLSEKISFLLKKYNVENYFIFDLKIPDLLTYLKMNLNVFARESEYENSFLLKNYVSGILIDAFDENTYNLLDINYLIKKWDKVCIISSELHGFDQIKFWQKLKEVNKYEKDKIIYLCTDYPDEASKYFNTNY